MSFEELLLTLMPSPVVPVALPVDRTLITPLPLAEMPFTPPVAYPAPVMLILPLAVKALMPSSVPTDPTALLTLTDGPVLDNA